MSAPTSSTGEAVAHSPVVSPLRHLDPAALSLAARAESRNREVHLPPVSSYRWWARRTESINGAILDAVSIDRPGRLLVVDPFAGGGVIPLATVIRGHRAYAQDLNPWATAGLVGMLSLATVQQLAVAGRRLGELAGPLLSRAYTTTFSDGRPAVLSHTFRVATATCTTCAMTLRIFPYAMVSLRARRERRQETAFLACPRGHVFSGSARRAEVCPDCGTRTDPAAVYTARRLVTCPSCGAAAKLDVLASGQTWRWQVALVERAVGRERELALPTDAEVKQAESGWAPTLTLPEIPPGAETRVLRRHGFRTWSDLYPPRQRVVTERLLALAVDAALDPNVVRALRLAIVGSTEMAGMLSRWDRYYLKSYESMAGHRFNFTTFTTEPNVWGTRASGRGSVRRRLVSFDKAAHWLRQRLPNGVTIEGPIPVSHRRTAFRGDLDVRVVEGASSRMVLTTASADLVLTDPPYHDDVQYDELSLPLRAWAEQSLCRLEGEAVANSWTGNNQSVDDYSQVLRIIFQECHRVLRRDGHLIFSYANREPSAWTALLAALQSAGFQAVGCAVVASENETDMVKRQVRACKYDLIMDTCPADALVQRASLGNSFPTDDEGHFLAVVGQTFMRVGRLNPDLLQQMESALHATTFLLKRG
jgi:putative DNA methylase